MALLIVIAATCGAQAVTESGWTIQQLPPGTPMDLRAVAVPDANTVVVVGASGTILRTTDGGTTWTRLASPTAANLNAVRFSDAKTGTAVGGAGTILRTEDGGVTWTRQSSGTTADICGVAFKDAETGIAVGSASVCNGNGIAPFDSGFILRTTDGGATWKSQATSIRRLSAIAFTDANTALAAGDQTTILTSSDSGATWTVLHNADKVIGGVSDIFFHDPVHGFAVGGGGIYYTRDGGVSWENRVFLSGNGPLFGVQFTDAYRGIAVGSRGLILRTTDGGLTWKAQASGVSSLLGLSSMLRDVAFSNAITGWAVGGAGLLRTTTGGDPGPVAVSAASLTAPVAAGSLASLTGAQLAASTAEADLRSPVTTLGGISLRVRDSAGQDRLASLLYVSPGQINFEVPRETSTGNAALEIVNAPSLLPQITVAVRDVAPGLFAFADGKAAAYRVRIEPDGRQTVLPPGTLILDERPVYLVAYGTGIRNLSRAE